METRICATTNDVFANDIKTSQKWGGKYNKRESIEQNRNQLAFFSDSWYFIRKITSRTSVFCCDRFSGERRQARGERKARGTKFHFIALLSSRVTSLRPNNLDITVSFGNIPIILIIPFINAFVLLGMMSKPREKKSCTWNTSAKKKKRETTTTEMIIRMIIIITTITIMIIIITIIILYSY